MSAREFQNRIHVGRLSKQMNWNNGFCPRAENSFESGRIHRVSLLLYIDEYRPGSTVGDGLGCSHECIRDGDDFIPRSNAAGQKRQPECFRSTANADGVATATVGRERFFEFLDKRATGKGAAINHLANRAVELVSQRRVLRLQIKKWYSYLHKSI